MRAYKNNPEIISGDENEKSNQTVCADFSLGRGSVPSKRAIR